MSLLSRSRAWLVLRWRRGWGLTCSFSHRRRLAIAMVGSLRFLRVLLLILYFIAATTRRSLRVLLLILYFIAASFVARNAFLFGGNGRNCGSNGNRIVFCRFLCGRRLLSSSLPSLLSSSPDEITEEPTECLDSSRGLPRRRGIGVDGERSSASYSGNSSPSDVISSSSSFPRTLYGQLKPWLSSMNSRMNATAAQRPWTAKNDVFLLPPRKNIFQPKMSRCRRLGNG